MRNTFFEYYILSDEKKINNIWNDAIIVLDANVLLNLYRYSEENKENLLNVLAHYKDRLWIPYQVGWEYHQNRISVYSDIDVAYDQIIASLENGTNEFLKKLNLSKYSRHPKIDINWFEDQIKSSMVKLCDHLRNMKDSCSDYTKVDTINERVAELFDGKVGDDFDESKLNKLYKEGQNRYSEKIPPGYCDAKEKKDRGNRHLYGDLIWWKQVIEYAREKGSNVILVTDDTKEDWYEKVKGKTIGPRKELLKEFRAETKKDILIYPTHRFLEYAKENMSVSVNQETIAEANEIHRENEAIDDIISSVSDESEELVVKIFSENPWMSAESLIQSSLNPADGLVTATTKYTDILGKGTLNPLEHIAGLTPDYTGVLGKSVLDSTEGLAIATAKYSDILGKGTLNPLERIAGLTPDYTGVLGKSVLDSTEGLATATAKYSDILGKGTLNPLERIAGLTPDYTGVLGKSVLDPTEGLATATAKYADILVKGTLNPLERITGFTPDYMGVLGKSVLDPTEGLATATAKYAGILGKSTLNLLEGSAKVIPDLSDTLGINTFNPIGVTGTLFSEIGKHYTTASTERKDDNSATE